MIDGPPRSNTAKQNWPPQRKTSHRWPKVVLPTTGGDMHWRKTTRLKKHDYTRCGYYFLTFNTSQRRHLLSHIEDGQVSLSALGRRCEELLNALPCSLDGLRVDTHVLMPDHVHLLIEIGPRCEVGVSALLRWFKSNATKHHIEHGGEGPLWQRGAYDVIVTDQEALARIREYIRLNPERWRR
jgi:putative transposase